MNLNQLEQGLEGFLDAIRWEFKDLLIIIDTFAEVAGGMDENKADDTRVALATLRQMARKRNCAVVLFHHTNKYGKTYRGSSAIRGAVDNLLYLRWANKEEKKAAQVGKGQPFVVLYDDARRRRAPFEPIHLQHVLIPKVGCEGASLEGEDEHIDDSHWDGFIWKALGPVGKEHSDGDVGDESAFWQDGEPDDDEHASPDVQSGSGDEAGMVATGKRERASVVIRAFQSFTDQLPRKKLEHYYAEVKHQSEESGKGAVKDAIKLGWIVKDSPAARAPYKLTEKGIRELKGLSSSRPPGISGQALTGKVLGEDRTPSEEPVGGDQRMQGKEGSNG